MAEDAQNAKCMNGGSRQIKDATKTLYSDEKSKPECKSGPRNRLWTSCLKKAKTVTNVRNYNHRQQNFDADDCIQISIQDPNYLHRLCLLFPFVCKIGEQTGCGPALLHEVCKERGWKEFQSNPNDPQSIPNPTGWNLWWQYGKTVISAGRSLCQWQITNFMDHKYNFTDKDVCSRFLTRLQKTYGASFDFGPMSFNLPNDYPRLCSEHSKRTKKEYMCSTRSNSAGSQRRLHCRDRQRSSEEPIWICKPVGKSRGRGITVFDTVTKIGYHTQSVVQEYISRPYLIGGYKWDLRIYVCIVSTKPLVIYAYREGIVRFATDQFTLKNLYNPYAHLTNTSLNKGSPSYRQPKQVIGKGCKWTLKKLRCYWNENNVRDWYLWQRILKILILTIVGDADNIISMSNSSKTFSLFGFDIMVDSSMKPYLLEVNKNPALGHDCDVDIIVKKPMLHDLFDLLGLPSIRHFESSLNKCLSEDEAWESCLHSLRGIQKLMSHKITAGTTNRSFRFPIVTPRKPRNERGPTKEHEISCCKAVPVRTSNSTNENCQHDKVRTHNMFNVKNPYFLLSGAPGNRKIHPPVLVKIPNQVRRKNKQEDQEMEDVITSRKAGLTLHVRNWHDKPTPLVGDWTQIFPFDNATDAVNLSGKDFDIRRVVNQLNGHLKNAKHIFKSQGTNCSGDAEFDSALQKSRNLNVPIWHPYVPPKGVALTNTSHTLRKLQL